MCKFLFEKGDHLMLKMVLFTIALLSNFSLFAEVSQGETLERQMWEDIKGQKWKDLENKIAPYFQAALYEGVLNKDQYMIHAKALNIDDLILSNFVVTKGPGVTVVTYELATSETIEGKRLSSKAVRLSVWQKNNANWQWVAHALLIPVLPPK